MPILVSDLAFRLSGGAGNANPNAALGGVMSGTVIVDATDNNLFDDVSGAESLAGDTEYRCLYIRNGHATLSYQAAKVWIETQTPSPDSSAQIGLDQAAVGNGTSTGVAATIANENTAPASVTFSNAAGEVNALTIGDIGPTLVKAVWVKRVINAAAAAYNADSLTIKHSGETAA